MAMCFVFTAFAEPKDKPAYMLFDNEGKAVSFTTMVDDLSQDDVVFIGEYHNSSLVHWFEHEVVEALADKHDNKLNLGMEMMEIDTQTKIDEYMAGLISEERYLAETYLWANYKMDYAPIVKLAKERGMRLVSTNVPRRYARALAYGGVEALRQFPESSKQYFGDVLDRVEQVNIPDNFFKDSPMSKVKAKAKTPMMGSMATPKKSPEEMKKQMVRMTQAQALKDAVMARSIANNLELPFVQICGAYHSDSRKGTVTFLMERKPDLKVGIITTVYQSELSKLDEKNKGKADYYIVLPEDTHKTY